MNHRRDAALALLGIERWKPKGSALASPEPEFKPVVPVPTPPVTIATPVVAAAATAASVAVEPMDWTALRAAVRDCTRCKLCKTRSNTVFGVGQDAAPLMVVGEGPGADEDAQGEPFVGRAGKLLDEMLKAIGRARGATDDASHRERGVFIANVVKCRPPGNRDPEKDEVEACRGYLDAQIAHVKPKLIVALGRIAAQRLLSSEEPLSRLRGPLHEYGLTRTPVFVTYHPAYLLRSPKEKAKSWEDLKKVAQHLKAHG